jgi:cytochrome c
MKLGNMFVVGALLALLAGCGSDRQGGGDAPSAEASAADPNRPASFAMCLSCHNAAPGDGAKLGPNLHGVAGAKAGSRPGYAYSEALKNSGLTWTTENLERFLDNPQALVPGTKMTARGPRDAAKRQEIVTYLATLGQEQPR